MRNQAENEWPTWFILCVLAIMCAFIYLAQSAKPLKHRAVTVIRGDFTVACDSTAEQGPCTLFWRDGRQGRVCDGSLEVPTER